MLNGDATCTAKIKTTFHVQHTFFVHFFNIVLHDLNVKFPSYTCPFTEGNLFAHKKC